MQVQHEFDIIAKLFSPLALGDKSALGLKDDVAFVLPNNFSKGLAITSDTLVENTHFLSDDPIDTIARKLVLVNKSDILAKGCKPVFALLNLTWPQNRSIEQLELFTKALGEELKGIALIGGDTTKSKDTLVLSLTMFGEPIRENPILRSGAKIGDLLFVTGNIGSAAVGLAALKNNKQDEFNNCVMHYRTPSLPPDEIAELIAEFAHASIDVSDGLLGDAQKLAAESGLGVSIDIEKVPVSPETEMYLAKLGDKLKERLRLFSFGDDYQALFCVEPMRAKEFLEAADNLEICITQIGECTQTKGLELKYNGTAVIYDGALSYSHNFE